MFALLPLFPRLSWCWSFLAIELTGCVEAFVIFIGVFSHIFNQKITPKSTNTGFWWPDVPRSRQTSSMAVVMVWRGRLDKAGYETWVRIAVLGATGRKWRLYTASSIRCAVWRCVACCCSCCYWCWRCCIFLLLQLQCCWSFVCCVWSVVVTACPSCMCTVPPTCAVRRAYIVLASCRLTFSRFMSVESSANHPSVVTVFFVTSLTNVDY